MKTQTFELNDLATYTIHTDSVAGRIIAVSKSGNSVTFQEDAAVLLNGPNSGEPDALQFSPGGFVGHTSGKQRWKCEANPNGSRTKFTRRTRKNGEEVWKAVGSGTNSPGNILRSGHNPHYDFNF